MGWIISSGAEGAEDDLPLGMVLPPSDTSDEVISPSSHHFKYLSVTLNYVLFIEFQF